MKKLNKFFAILVAMAMVLTLSIATAFAEDPPANPTDDTDIHVTKTLQIPQGLSTVAETFAFVGTLDKVDGNDATAAEQQALGLSGSIAYTAGETDEDADGYIRKDTTLAYPTWTHAGVYEYTLTETAGNTTGMTYDDSEYKVTVYVANDGEGGFEVTNVVVTDEDENKVDVDDPGDDDQPTGGQNQTGETKASGANFTNTYTKIADETPTDDPDDPDKPGTETVASFVIGKTITGAYSDMGKEFKFELTINADPAKTYVNNPTITVTKDGVAITPDENGVYSFDLGHEDEVVVEGAPVGTLYTVTENLANDDAAAKKYTASVEVKEDGNTSDKSVAKANSTEGADLTVTNALVGDAASYAEYTNENTKDEVTPTGILISNLPYIALALVAIGGLVAYVVVRRRQDDEA